MTISLVQQHTLGHLVALYTLALHITNQLTAQICQSLQHHVVLSFTPNTTCHTHQYKLRDGAMLLSTASCIFMSYLCPRSEFSHSPTTCVHVLVSTRHHYGPWAPLCPRSILFISSCIVRLSATNILLVVVVSWIVRLILHTNLTASCYPFPLTSTVVSSR